jgi:hypothetical protein
VVWVRKPGPIDEFAIKNAAPNPAPLNQLYLFFEELDGMIGEMMI